MWKRVDAMTQKSAREFSDAKADIEALPGWKFKGCPDGLAWKASNQRERIDLSDRTAYGLVAKVKSEQARLEAKAKAREEAEQARKTGGR